MVASRFGSPAYLRAAAAIPGVGAGNRRVRVLEAARDRLTAREGARVDERLQVLLVDVPVADRDHDRPDAEDQRPKKRDARTIISLAALSPCSARGCRKLTYRTPALSASTL